MDSAYLDDHDSRLESQDRHSRLFIYLSGIHAFTLLGKAGVYLPTFLSLLCLLCLLDRSQNISEFAMEGKQDGVYFDLVYGLGLDCTEMGLGFKFESDRSRSMVERQNGEDTRLLKRLTPGKIIIRYGFERAAKRVGVFGFWILEWCYCFGTDGMDRKIWLFGF